jgi:hypothetical protein
VQGFVRGRYQPGHSYVERWNHAPFGPAFSEILSTAQAIRDGDELTLSPTIFSEVSSPSRAGASLGTRHQALFRDGRSIFDQTDDGTDLIRGVTVPPERANYRLEVDATRGPEVSGLSPHVTAAWTFTSEHTDVPQVLSVPTLRFAPVLDDDNRALRRLPLLLPVAIERLPGAATPAIRNVTIEVSFDDGATWSPVHGALLGTRFLGLVVHPPGATFVALRGTARDAAGNRVEQTILRAYQLR